MKLLFIGQLLAAMMLTTVVKGFFTGTITPDNSQIQMVDRVYTFNLSYNTVIREANSKIVIRFPYDFQDQFEITSCRAISGFDPSVDNLDYEYIQSVRILTIFLTQPPDQTVTELKFTLSGIKNPRVAATTNFFDVTSYENKDRNGLQWSRIETSDGTLKMQFTPGALSGPSLSLLDSTVGKYSDLTVAFTIQHDIPIANGMINVQFPKWNPGARVEDQQSYVDTFTTSVAIPCEAQDELSLAVESLACTFSTFTGFDMLTVTFVELTNQQVPAGPIKFVVQGIRGPPTTKAVDGFSINTASQSIDDGVQVVDVIDQSSSPITLKVNDPEPILSSNMIVTADYQSIQWESTLTFKVHVNNPLDPDSSIAITMSDDFTVPSAFETVTIKTIDDTSAEAYPLCGSPAATTERCYNWDVGTATIVFNKFNPEYVPLQTNIYIEVGKVNNPVQAGPSSTFAYVLSDAEANPIETVTAGVFFYTTAGGFSEIEISAPAGKRTINEANVPFTFRMQPENAFGSSAVIKITLPAQLELQDDQPAVQIGPNTGQLRSVAASEVSVRFNRIVVVDSGYALSNRGDEFVLIVSGFVNPPTTQQTDAFEVVIYENSSEQDVVVQSDANSDFLKFQAEASNDLEMSAVMSETKTGEVQTRFIISGRLTSLDQSIVKQAYLRVLIPSDFTVSDRDRVAATCTAETGFSDEISCAFETVGFGNQEKLYLVVSDGFDSQDFTETSFSFSIGEIQNPKDTKPTESFQMTVHDKTGGEMYQTLNSVQLTAEPSNFAFVYVESTSDVNGDPKASYILTLTLGVNTPNNAWLEFVPPPQITFVQGGLETARGTQNLQESLPQRESAVAGGRDFQLASLDGSDFPAGATVQLEVGYLKNAMSLQSSDPFKLVTFIEDSQASPSPTRYEINQSVGQVRVTNSISGPITITDFQHFATEELGEATQLRLSFTTTSPIPETASMTLTLPAILTVATDAEFKLNGEVRAERTINAVAKQFALAAMPVGSLTSFTVEITSGLTNPAQGPYALNYLQVEFQNSEGFSIDKVTGPDEVKTVGCVASCGTCDGDRSTCTSCPIGFYLKDNQCLDDCGTGYYAKIGMQQCDKCDDKCLECRVQSDSCTVCNPAIVPQTPYADPLTLQCYDECPAGTYLDEASTQCLRCESPCYTCSSKEFCLSCDRTDEKNLLVYFLPSKGQCYTECPSISVPTPSKQCEECESPCETCENLTKNCLTCIEGHFLHKNNECVSSCPFLYFEDKTERKCKYFGELSIPVPFSITAFVLTVGIGVSVWVKGADREGREQKGTAFFVTMLALVDMLLRVCWIILAYSVYEKEFYTTFGLLLGILILSVFINIFLWRRYFQTVYKYEETDPLFAAYIMKYPATANIIIFLSYLITFQAIRLTYSRFLGKKMFMARFQKRLRYFRLIGRLTVLETLFIYLPAVATNIYSLTVIKEKKDTQYWLNIDSMVLVLYALILITVVLTQREQLMSYTSYFKFSELFTFGDDADTDDQVDLDDNDPATKALGNMASQNQLETDPGDEQIDVHSACGHEDVAKMKMYQLEQRYRSLDDLRGSKNRPNDGRVVSVTDFHEYRKLEDKRDRIMLKKTLYERKKVNDESQVVLLNEELNKYQRKKDELNTMIPQLKKQLRALQKKIVTVDKTRKKELFHVEQEKRRDIIRRAGREVPYQSQPGATKPSKAQQQQQVAATPANANGVKATEGVKADPQNAVAHEPNKDSTDSRQQQQNQQKAMQQTGKRRGRGGQRGQQIKSLSPEQNRAKNESDEPVIMQQSPTMFAEHPQVSDSAVNDLLQMESDAVNANAGGEEPDPIVQSFGAPGAASLEKRQEEEDDQDDQSRE